MSEETKSNNNQINIELSEEISEGIYSNLAIISHSPSEFVLDFVRLDVYKRQLQTIPPHFNNVICLPFTLSLIHISLHKGYQPPPS